MPDTKTAATAHARVDRPSETLALINIEHTPWHEEDNSNRTDRSQHRRYRGLFEDIMN